MRHSVEPVGYRVTIPATHTAEQYNPFCGDRIALSLEVVDDRIRQAAFDGEACAMCLASASLLCAGAPGCTTAELQQRKDWLAQALEPSGTSIDGHAHPALLPLLGVKRFPSRVKCVMLPWLAAADALSTLQPRS
jgi:nitrogen fixation NifU-like protein